MHQRAAVDAAVFITLGTFIATYALLLVSSQNSDQRLTWLSGRDAVTRRDPVFMTLTLVGVFSVTWGGTELQDHTSTWLAILVAVGPLFVLRTVIVLAHNRRLTRTSEMPPTSEHPV